MITGPELFRKIHEQISLHPETHDQTCWWYTNPACGTVACIAGWAVQFNAEKGESLDDAAERLADELRVPESGEDNWTGVSRRLLGLTFEEAEDLFLHTPTDRAAQYVARRAQEANMSNEPQPTTDDDVIEVEVPKGTPPPEVIRPKKK